MKAITRLARILGGVLRGLSDEDAYARYLAHHGIASSPTAWRRFCEQRARARYNGSACC